MKTQVALITVAVSAVALIALRPAAAQVAGFSDVPDSHWAAQSIGMLAKAGVLNGYSSAPLAVGAPDKTAKKKAAYDGNKPVTRYELAVTLYRFVQYMERADKQKKTAEGAMVQPKSGAQAVKLLVDGGYLPKNSKLVANAASGGSKPVTASEFAAALGDVLTKVKEKATPISKGSELDIQKPETHTH